MATTKITTPELFNFSDLNTALQLPSGNNASRPSAPSDGEWRFNIEEKYVEYYDSGTTAWYQIDTEAIANPDDFPEQNFNVSTYYGNATARTLDAKFNQAANFNGASSGSQIFIADADVFSPANNDLSFSVWINTKSTNVGYIACKQNDGVPAYEWQFYMNTNGTVAIGVYTSSGSHIATATSTATVNDGNWHNVAFVIDTNTSVTVYVDKAGVTNSSWSGTMSNTSTDVGLGYGGENMSGNRLEGALDQARFFNTALTSTQIDSLYDSETTTTAATLDFPSGAGCFAAYPLDGDASDLSGTYGGFTTDVGYTGLLFQPDFVWTKNRGLAEPHMLYDSVRGVEQTLYSNDTDTQYNDSGSLTSFDSKGFSLGTYTGTNRDGYDFVAWCWKAGGAPTTDNVAGAGNVPTAGSFKIDGADSTTAAAGTIAAKRLTANTEAGFSIVQYDGGTGTLPHGLGVTPSLLIQRNINGGTWYVYLSPGVLDSNYNYLELNNTGTGGTTGSTPPTSTTFNPVSSSGNYIAYIFANISGYQKIGKYTGTGSDKGNYIFTDSNGDGTGNDGFEPAFLLVKRTDDTAGWFIYDNKRVYGSEAPGNALDGELRPNENFAEDDYSGYNFYSNGFEVANSGTNMNANGGTYVYLAIAANKDSSVPTAANSFVNTTYTGTSATQNIYTPFKPDFVWTKVTSTTNNHYSFDSVRGRDLAIYPDLTNAEYNEVNSLLSFAPNGFQIGTAGGVSSAFPRVAWNWKAGGKASLNVTGDISAIISANQAGGFSVVRYRGNGGSGQTVAHGLSQAPTYVIFKNLTDSVNWFVWIYDTGSSTYKRLEGLNTNPTAASVTSFGADASKITWSGTPADFNTLNKDYVMYCWHSVTNYSQMGIYNGSAADVVVSTGFQPTFVMVKNLDDAVPWGMVSSQVTGILYADSSGGESAYSASGYLTLNSNNFTLIGGTGSYFNDTGYDYVYMAFA